MPFDGFTNQMPQRYKFPKNNNWTITKRDIGYKAVDKNIPGCNKRQRFDHQVNENNFMFANYQNVNLLYLPILFNFYT